ncbi:MAG: OmpW family outer membrane protein, partial [Pseudomonadota bacterium]
MRKSRLAIAAHAAILLVSIPVSAHQEGDIIVRGGFTAVVPNDDSDAINLPTDPATVLPGGVGVDTGYALGLTGVWMITDIWGLELLAATPFEHDIDVKDLNID